MLGLFRVDGRRGLLVLAGLSCGALLASAAGAATPANLVVVLPLGLAIVMGVMKTASA